MGKRGLAVGFSDCFMLESFHRNDRLADEYVCDQSRKGEMVTSDVGKQTQKRFWSEVKELWVKEAGVSDLDRYFE